MNKINSLKKIAELTENDMRVFLSLVFNEELSYTKEEAIAEFDNNNNNNNNNNIENVLEESYFRHLIGPKLRTVVDEMMEKLTQRKLNKKY